MSGKTVELKPLDTRRVDAFVEKGSARAETTSVAVEPIVAMRQLTVEVPESLHGQLRMQCARLDLKSYEVVRKALAESLERLENLNRSEAVTWLGSRRQGVGGA